MVNMIANAQVLTTIDLHFTKRIINSLNTEFESNLSWYEYIPNVVKFNIE